MSGETFLRIEDVMRLTGLPKPSLYRHIKNGEFPASFKIAKRTAVWREKEVLDWQRAKLAKHAGAHSPEAA